MRIFLLFFIVSVYQTFSWAQMVQTNGDVLLGHEWIDFDQSYYKIHISEDGMYELPLSSCPNFPFGSVNGRQLQLWHLGQQVPIQVEQTAALTAADAIVFYAQKNRASIDQFLFANAKDEMLNPSYSLVNDTAAYFLTWSTQDTGLRWQWFENDISNPPSAEPFVEAEVIQTMNDQLVWRRYDLTQQSLVAYSQYDRAEGYASAFSDKHIIEISLPQRYTTDPAATARIRLASNNNARSINSHELEISIGSTVYDRHLMQQYDLYESNFSLDAADVQNRVDIQLQGLKGSQDQYAYAVVQIDYRSKPHADNQSQFSFSLPPAAQSRYLEIDGLQGLEGDAVSLYNVQTGAYTQSELSGGLVRLYVPPQSSESSYLLFNHGAQQQPGRIHALTFDASLLEPASFVIVTDPRLYTDANGQNPVTDYAAHRRSQIGGSHTTKIAEVQQLCDMFAYGISRHPLSVKNYANFLDQFALDDPYMLLLGHGYQYDFIRETDAAALAQHFVPAYGIPASDNLLVSEGTQLVPLISVGRISAQNGEEVRAYLNKLIAYESNLYNRWDVPNQVWRKNVLHLVGGSLSETTFISSLLNGMGNVIEQSKIGAEVQSIKKESSDPVQLNTTERVIQAVNEGALIKTFFGHGGVTNTDFGLDDPNIFDLGERYPLALSLGCLTGNAYDQQTSAAERFVLTPNKGAIGYIATSGFGYPTPLRNVAQEFYNQIGNANFGKGIGRSMRFTNLALRNNTAFPTNSLLQQWCLQGDPAIRLHLYDAPDYVPTLSSVRIEPEILDVEQDSFQLYFSIVNLGAVDRDTMTLSFSRQAENGQRMEWKDTVQVSGSQTEFAYTLPVLGQDFSDRNVLQLNIDADNTIAEQPLPIAESNNSWQQGGVEFVVLDSRMRAKQPLDFAIVSGNEVALYAYTSSYIPNGANCLFQLDTSAYFNSPLLSQEIVRTQGGTVQLPIETPLLDSMVYYWRVAIDDGITPNTERAWSSRSFLYIQAESPNGWNQSHFHQYQSNSLSQLELKEPGREFTFAGKENAILALSHVTSDENNTRSRFYINNFEWAKLPLNWGGGTYDQIHVTVFDPISGQNWGNPYPGRFGSDNLRNSSNPWPGFVYRPQIEQSRHALIRFLKDSIPDGHYVLLLVGYYEGRTIGSSSWAQDTMRVGTNLYRVLEAEGATLFRQMQTEGDLPYALGYVKGEGVLDEAIGQSQTDFASINFAVPSLFSEGALRSTVIGPAYEWGSLDWQIDAQESDSFYVDIYAYSDSQLIRLYEGVQPGFFDLSSVNATQYPLLQLQWHVADSLLASPPQLSHWRVWYEGVGDAALSPDLAYTFSGDSLQQGQSLQLQMAIQNIGQRKLDSLAVRFSLTDENNLTTVIDKTYAPLAIGDSLEASIEIDTRNNLGLQTLSILANPGPQQLESNYDNNFSARSFQVYADDLNPLLDVTFDGVRIMNGDLVSARPEIIIELRDENPYLRLNDTSLLEMQLVSPNGKTKRIGFADASVDFFPASTAKANKARVEWRPDFEMDGQYSLQINGRDATDNQAGIIRYNVQFEVVRKRSISYLLPYPNPFSTQCRFAYVLTGDKSPDVFKLQIMTVSGKVVREISKAEFGELRVGKHLSDYVWDGTDNYGQPLANGVYLYRVITRNLDEAIEKYDNGTGRFFKKDFGKLVIMR